MNQMIGDQYNKIFTNCESNLRYSNSHYNSSNKMSLSVTSKHNLKSPYFLHISENAIINANPQRIFPHNSVFFTNEIERTNYRDIQKEKNIGNQLYSKSNLDSNEMITLKSNNSNSNIQAMPQESIDDPKVAAKVNEINSQVNEIEKAIELLFIQRREFQEEHRLWREDRKKKIIQVKKENLYMNHMDDSFSNNSIPLFNHFKTQIPNF